MAKPDWFSKLSTDRQKAYLKDHPLSKQKLAPKIEKINQVNQRRENANIITDHFVDYYSKQSKPVRYKTKEILKKKKTDWKDTKFIANQLNKFQESLDKTDSKKLGAGIIGAGAATTIIATGNIPLVVGLGTLAVLGYLSYKSKDFIYKIYNSLKSGTKNLLSNIDLSKDEELPNNKKESNVIDADFEEIKPEPKRLAHLSAYYASEDNKALYKNYIDYLKDRVKYLPKLDIEFLELLKKATS